MSLDPSGDRRAVMRVVSYGGGVNSAAMVVGLCARGDKPDLCIFADTGAEKPPTYAHLELMGAWLALRDIRLVTVRNPHGPLEQISLQRKELPSKAYGFSGCSVKWKRQPMDQWLRKQPECTAVWERGELIERCIGIDAGEQHRAVLTKDKEFQYRYPLCEWGWDRDECLAAIEKAGLPVPPKSSCFFCPSMKKGEILDLAAEHPDLAARAVALEANAVRKDDSEIMGLGGRWRWGDFLNQDRRQMKLFPDPPPAPCACYDGD